MAVQYPKRAIWKYALQVVDEQPVRMPSGAEILTVQMQGANLCLWACVVPGAEESIRHIRIYGTGHEMDPGMHRYIGTFQMHGGALVFHAYEVSQ